MYKVADFKFLDSNCIQGSGYEYKYELLLLKHGEKVRKILWTKDNIDDTNFKGRYIGIEESGMFKILTRDELFQQKLETDKDFFSSGYLYKPLYECIWETDK